MDNKNTYVIYVHVNKINKKMYIGQTCYKEPNIRWANGNGYKRQKKFWNAIEKYGWDGFEHIVLFEHLSLEMANLIEKELIKKYNTTGKNGYNIEFGGKNSKLSEETKEKLSNAHKGKKVSDETKKKISKATKGSSNPFYNKKHTDETKLKMKINHADFSGENSYWYGKHHSDETKEKLRQANLGKNSCHFGKHRSEETKEKIRKALTGQTRTTEQKQHIKDNHAHITGEKNWCYGIPKTEEHKKKLSIKCSTPVDMFDLENNYIRSFHGMSEAERQTGISYVSIGRCCNNKQKTAGGYKWKYSNKTFE